MMAGQLQFSPYNMGVVIQELSLAIMEFSNIYWYFFPPYKLVCDNNIYFLFSKLDRVFLFLAFTEPCHTAGTMAIGTVRGSGSEPAA
jgi:hypothetical protein